MRVEAGPQVDVGALEILRVLLNEVAGAGAAAGIVSSNALVLGVPKVSHDQNRGEADATPAESSSPTSEQNTAVRFVRGAGRRQRDTKAEVADAAERDASGADGTDGAHDPRTRAGTLLCPTGGEARMMSEKIRPHHLERKAILYVRQSSAHQVLHNRESSALQYAMRDRLTALGWSRDRDSRRRSRPLGGRRRRPRRIRAHGGRGLPRQGRGGRGAGGLALRPKQPRLAAAHRDVPRRRHGTDRPGDRLRPTAG